MDEVVDHINDTSSPQELAIQFLLRHAACRVALTSRANDGDQGHLVAAAHPLDAGSAGLEAASESRGGTTVETRSAPSAAMPAEDSFAGRFARAYAAARQFSASERHWSSAKSKAA